MSKVMIEHKTDLAETGWLLFALSLLAEFSLTSKAHTKLGTKSGSKRSGLHRPVKTAISHVGKNKATGIIARGPSRSSAEEVPPYAFQERPTCIGISRSYLSVAHG